MNEHVLPLPPAADDPERRRLLMTNAAAGGVAAVATGTPFVATRVTRLTDTR